MPFSASLGSLDLPHNKSICCNYFNTWSQDLRREMTSNIFIIVESLSRSYLWDLTVVLPWAAMLISASSASHHRILPCSSRNRQKNPSNADMPVVYMNVSCLLLIINRNLQTCCQHKQVTCTMRSSITYILVHTWPYCQYQTKESCTVESRCMENRCLLVAQPGIIWQRFLVVFARLFPGCLPVLSFTVLLSQESPLWTLVRLHGHCFGQYPKHCWQQFSWSQPGALQEDGIFI